jgi:SAM-dependent methyltransferase
MDKNWNATHIYFQKRQFGFIFKRIQSYCRFRGVMPLKILDIGCHDGDFLFYLAERFKAQKHILDGLDIVERYIEEAKKRNVKNNLPINKFYIMNVEKELPQEKYDIVIIQEVVEHLVNPFDLLFRIRKILSPNGLLIMTSVNHNSYIHVLGKFINKSTGGFSRNLYWTGNCTKEVPPLSTTKEFKEHLIHDHISTKSAIVWIHQLRRIGYKKILWSPTMLLGGSLFWVKHQYLFKLHRIFDNLAIRENWGKKYCIGFMIECQKRNNQETIRIQT